MRIQVPNEPNTQYHASDPCSSHHARSRVGERVQAGAKWFRNGPLIVNTVAN